VTTVLFSCFPLGSASRTTGKSHFDCGPVSAHPTSKAGLSGVTSKILLCVWRKLCIILSWSFYCFLHGSNSATIQIQWSCLSCQCPALHVFSEKQLYTRKVVCVMSVCLHVHRSGLKLSTEQYVLMMLHKVYTNVYTWFQFVCSNFLSLLITPSDLIISLTNGHSAVFWVGFEEHIPKARVEDLTDLWVLECENWISTICGLEIIP